MTVYRLHPDESGETHLTRLEHWLETPTDASPTQRMLGPIPAGVMSIRTSVGAPAAPRAADDTLHNALARHFIIFLAGEFEVTTSTGEQAVLQAGDCLLADDVTGKGHLGRSVGTVPTTMAHITIADDWVSPES